MTSVFQVRNSLNPLRRRAITVSGFTMTRVDRQPLPNNPGHKHVVIAARVCLIRCYAKNVKTDLTANEKKQLRQIAAYLKGAP